MTAPGRQSAVAVVPDGWTPSAGPDPVLQVEKGLVGTPRRRLDAPSKVRGEARFAAEHVMDGMVYAALRFSTIAKGRVTSLDTAHGGSGGLVSRRERGPAHRHRRDLVLSRDPALGVTVRSPGCRPEAATSAR